MIAPRSFLRYDKQQVLGDSFGDDTSWLIIMSDLTLLLLCAFLVWYIVDKHEAGQTQLSSATPAIIPNSTPYSPVQLDLNDSSFSSRTGTILSAGGVHDPIPPIVAQWGTIERELEKYITTSGLGESIDVASTQHEILLTLKDTVLFDSGKADLRKQILPIFAKVATLARNHPDLALEVLGHTDDVPIATVEFPSNWELSSARASRVARRLIDTGVAPTRVSAQGYSSFRPVFPNTNAENRAANRRVEIRFYRAIEHPTVSNNSTYLKDNAAPEQTTATAVASR